MSTFNYSNMSQDERQFIRMYCVTVQREYDFLQIVRGLMEPAGLGIRDVVHAVRCAKQLHKLQIVACQRIEALSKQPTQIKVNDKATPEQIATIFTQSFFKLVDSQTKKALITDKNFPPHDGWSSGHPIDWQHMIKSLHEISQQQQAQSISKHSLLLSALLKLFTILPPNLTEKKWEEDDSDVWDEYDEEDYDEEDYDNDEDYYDDQDDEDPDYYM